MSIFFFRFWSSLMQSSYMKSKEDLVSFDRAQQRSRGDSVLAVRVQSVVGCSKSAIEGEGRSTRFLSFPSLDKAFSLEIIVHEVHYCSSLLTEKRRLIIAPLFQSLLPVSIDPAETRRIRRRNQESSTFDFPSCSIGFAHRPQPEEGREELEGDRFGSHVLLLCRLISGFTFPRI